MRIVPGQRWTSTTESELGLGLVTEVDGRRATFSFPAAGETRTYAIDSAPLSRIRYGVGDRVRDHDDQSYRIQAIDEEADLLIYHCIDDDGHTVRLAEIELNAFVQFTTPRQRMLSGQFDRNADFELRVATLEHIHRLQQSPVRGLLGCRTSLLPHQIHIASEVAGRHAPRVLLADEVGLGKTIEAGMILHRQLHTHQARRVLILVPDSLVHQWLVEMLRRFNLRFAIFDATRVEALADAGYDNPFDSEQRVLCGMDIVTGNETIRRQLIDTEWDMVVVDEAHHLRWLAPGETGDDTARHTDERIAYDFVEQLAVRSAGLLLLTATPEQAGVTSHFARLRLLDPARFHDLAAYRDEEAGYPKLNHAVAPLLGRARRLNEAERKALRVYLGRDPGAEPDEPSRQSMVGRLLDRHGTGRILFRNTRAAVPDFPPRRPLAFVLGTPAVYKATMPNDIDAALYPESRVAETVWLREDPRVRWLAERVKSEPLEKFLIICHRKQTARALDRHLTLREGIRSTSFYEDLSIVERDRAAAYFAEGQDDPGGGAQTLVCSEIGSEGRNFQFAHRLVLFDLPPLPDLLEQRIGRLDRIGQTEPIRILIPYLRDTAQEVLYHWYHEGMGLFAKSFAAGQAVYERFGDRLQALLLESEALDRHVMQTLSDDTAAYATQLGQALRAGRDRLLELNSCNPDSSAQLIDAIIAEEQSGSLQAYAERLFDQHGVEHEFHSNDALVLHPGTQMSGNFPGVDEDGTTVTFSRAKALAREDMEFLSWEHPMMVEAMEMVRDSEFGNSALATISLNKLPSGTILLEACFTVSVVAPKVLQLERFLPLHPSRFLIAQNNSDTSALISHDQLNRLCQPVAPDAAREVMAHLRPVAETMLTKATELARGRLPGLRDGAIETMRKSLGAELERLAALARVNPTIRTEELQHIRNRLAAGALHIGRAAIRLQALRLIINNPAS